MKQCIIVAVVFFSAMTLEAEVWEGKHYENINTESDNYIEYLQACGLGYIARSTIASDLEVVKLKKIEDNKYKLVIATFSKNSEIIFEPGKEFDDTTLDDLKVKSVMTFEGNKLIQKQGSDPPSTIIREFKENEMITTLKVKDVTATRKYETREY